MAGHGALMDGLVEFDRFVSASAFSVICHPSIVPWGIKAFTGNCDIRGESGRHELGAGASFISTLFKNHGKRTIKLIEKNFNVFPGKYVEWLATDYMEANAYWNIAVELLRKHKKRFAVPRCSLIDQGDADQFLETHLMPNELAMACAEGYNHSFYFVSTFIGEHLESHVKNLSKL
ncbi:hypothetical protein Aperf_G00000009953 [Anoplocephala perfoliata]